MDNTKPYSGVSVDRLTALINRINGVTRILDVDFTFSPPQAYTDAQGRNTKVTMLRVPGAKFKSDKEVHYHRLPLTVLNDLPPSWIKPVAIPQLPFTLHGILDEINDALGLNLLQEEVVDTTYTTAQSSYALPINEPESFAWINSNYAFAAIVTGIPTPLAEIIRDTDLENGLVYLQPDERA